MDLRNILEQSNFELKFAPGFEEARILNFIKLFEDEAHPYFIFKYIESSYNAIKKDAASQQLLEAIYHYLAQQLTDQNFILHAGAYAAFDLDWSRNANMILNQIKVHMMKPNDLLERLCIGCAKILAGNIIGKFDLDCNSYFCQQDLIFKLCCRLMYNIIDNHLIAISYRYDDKDYSTVLNPNMQQVIDNLQLTDGVLKA